MSSLDRNVFVVCIAITAALVAGAFAGNWFPNLGLPAWGPIGAAWIAAVLSGYMTWRNNEATRRLARERQQFETDMQLQRDAATKDLAKHQADLNGDLLAAKAKLDQQLQFHKAELDRAVLRAELAARKLADVLPELWISTNMAVNELKKVHIARGLGFVANSAVWDSVANARKLLKYNEVWMPTSVLDAARSLSAALHESYQAEHALAQNLPDSTAEVADRCAAAQVGLDTESAGFLSAIRDDRRSTAVQVTI